MTRCCRFDSGACTLEMDRYVEKNNIPVQDVYSHFIYRVHTWKNDMPAQDVYSDFIYRATPTAAAPSFQASSPWYKQGTLTSKARSFHSLTCVEVMQKCVRFPRLQGTNCQRGFHFIGNCVYNDRIRVRGTYLIHPYA